MPTGLMLPVRSAHLSLRSRQPATKRSMAFPFAPKNHTDEHTELAAQSGEGPALGSLEDPRARANARKNRDDEEEADISDGGDPENPRYAGSDIVADDEED